MVSALCMVSICTDEEQIWVGKCRSKEEERKRKKEKDKEKKRRDRERTGGKGLRF